MLLTSRIILIFVFLVPAGPAFIVFIFSSDRRHFGRRLVLVGESREGFVEGHSSDPHRLSGREENFVGCLKDLLISLVSETFITYVGPYSDRKFVRPQAQDRRSTTAVFHFCGFLAKVVNYLETKL